MFRFLKNTISFIIFFILRIVFHKNKKFSGNSILVINTGQIGDLMVTSILIDNQNFLPNSKYFLLINEKYVGLFSNKLDKFQIITYNSNRYKYSLPYRISFIRKIRSLKILKCFNVTAARGFINDELSLLSGGKDVFTTCSSHKYLGSFYGNLMNKKYKDIIFSNEINEYKKHISLIKLLSDNNEIEVSLFNNISLSTKNDRYEKYLSEKYKNNYLLISPLVSIAERGWDLDKYQILIKQLSQNEKIILTCADSEIYKLRQIAYGQNNVFIESCSLIDLPALIKNCKLFIGNDSGLTHIALKLDKPFVCILDGGYFNMWFPIYEKENYRYFVYNKMDCFTCDWDCIYKIPYCIKNISVNSVLETIKKINV